MEEPPSSTTDLVKAGVSGSIEALIEPVSTFLKTLLGPATTELGAWGGDAIAFRRWKSSVRMLGKAEQFLRETGREPREVALPILVPILDASGNEENGAMSNRWAALLANASGWDDRVRPRFPSILRDLSPQDATLLDALFDATDGNTDYVSVLGLDVPLNPEQRAISVDILIGEELCVPQRPTTLGVIAENRQGLFLTALGSAFVRACRPPEDREPSQTRET